MPSTKSILFSYTNRVWQEFGFKKARFFFLRSLVSPRAIDWLGFIDSFYLMHGFHFAPGAVAKKLLRSYSSRHFTQQQRFDLLTQHYTFLSTAMKSAELKALLNGQEIVIAHILGKSGHRYDFVFSQKEQNHYDGELSIAMVSCQDQAAVATLTATFSGTHGADDAVMWIGGLQGPRDKLDKSDVVRITRDLNGLRPKYAVLTCAYEVAQYFKVKKIEAVSQKNHVSNSKRNLNFYADYDAFWQEVGGVEDLNGNYVLPSQLPKRSIDEVPSKKKKDWRAKQMYLEQITAQLAVAIQIMLL